MAQEHIDAEVMEGQVIPYQARSEVPVYRFPATTRLPERTRQERSLLFGFLEDRQEAAHLRRMNSITDKIVEAAHGAQGALALDVEIVKATGDTAEALHGIVSTYRPNSIGEMTAAEMTGLAIARNRLRVAAIGDAVDAHILNVIQRS